MTDGNRVRLCMKDLYGQDVVEMIERETRRYELWSIESPDHPDFKAAFDLLWEAFGESGEMEREDSVRGFLREDVYEPDRFGTFMRYFLLVARDRDGRVRGVRDGTILYNPAYSSDLVVVYLSHIYMLPDARGTVLSYWLRIAPVELAMQFMVGLSIRGLARLPNPDAPGRHFGLRVNLAAEMEYFSPEDRLSLQRILFYGRGGFDAINPRHFPYRQPDFREPEVIAKTGNMPHPFMILLRRMGRERQARLPISEARTVLKLLYDDFAAFCEPEYLANSLDVVLERLEQREARGKDSVELLPLPSGPRDIGRLKRLFRYNVYRQYYGMGPETRAYLEGPIRDQVYKSPGFLDEELRKIRTQLNDRPHYVFESRGRGFSWEGEAAAPSEAGDLGDASETVEVEPR